MGYEFWPSAKENKELERSDEVAFPAVKRLVINRFIYHYCAHYQGVIGSLTYIDGIAQMEKRIFSMDGYRKLKEHIDPENHDKLTIDSLSFLCMEKGA